MSRSSSLVFFTRAALAAINSLIADGLGPPGCAELRRKPACVRLRRYRLLNVEILRSLKGREVLVLFIQDFPFFFFWVVVGFFLVWHCNAATARAGKVHGVRNAIPLLISASFE